MCIVSKRRKGAQKKSSAALSHPQRQRHCAVCATTRSSLTGAAQRRGRQLPGAWHSEWQTSTAPAVLLSAPKSAVPHHQPARSRDDAGCHVRRKSSSHVSGQRRMRARHCGEGTLSGVARGQRALVFSSTKVLLRSTWFLLSHSSPLHTHCLYNPTPSQSVHSLQA